METTEGQAPSYPWNPSNYSEIPDNLIYTSHGLRALLPDFTPAKEGVYISQRVQELIHDYKHMRDPHKSIYKQSIPDIVNDGNQEVYFRPVDVPLPKCHLPSMEVADFQQTGFEAHTLTEEMAAKNKHLLDRIGTFSPALSLMLERPAAIVTQSIFIKRLDEHIKYEVEKCDCPQPGYTMSWLFDMIRTNSILAEQPELIIEDEPDEKRMARYKIYQKAFTSLILHFENLRPILRDIKRTYEAVINMRTRQIREVLAIKKSIEQYEKLLDVKKEDIQREGYTELNEMQQQCFLLMRHVDKQDAALRTMTEMLKELEKSLIEEHDLRFESEEQRKSLIVEVNELRRKYGLGPTGGGTLSAAAYLTKTSATEESEEEDILLSEDPILLRTTLENTRKTLSEAYHRMTILDADYADVVPMEDYNLVKAEADRVTQRNEAAAETFGSLSSQIDGLHEQIETLLGDRNKLEELLDDLRTKPTPRPSWSKIGEHFTKLIEFDDASNRWADVYDGNSSDQIAQKLIEHITGKSTRPNPGTKIEKVENSAIPEGDFITPLGLSSAVPKYLRFNFYIINRHFSRREAISVSQEIWQSRIEQLELYKKIKDAQDAEESGNYGYGYGIADSSKKGAEPVLPDELPTILPFPDYVAQYFKERFHLLHLRMEWTYNIIEACKRYATDIKLAQFLGTLESRFDEAAYHCYRAQLDLIRTLLTKKSEEEKSQGGGLLSSTMREIFKVNFPFKTVEQIDALLEAACKQTGNYSKVLPIKYATFFVQTEDGLVGDFVTEVAKQLQDDSKKYVYEILGELLGELGVSLVAAENSEIDPAGDTDVTLIQVYLAITTVDPTITPEKLGAAIAWIFLGESTLPGQASKALPLVDYIKSSIRRKDTQTSGSGEGSEGEEDDHEDDEFERVVQSIQQKRHSIVADLAEPNEDEEKRERQAIRRLKVANLRTVMKRLKGSALLRHGVRHTHTDSSPPSSAESIKEESGATNGTAIANNPEANTNATATKARKSIGPPPPVPQNSEVKSDKKKSVSIVDIYKRGSATSGSQKKGNSNTNNTPASATGASGNKKSARK